MLQHTATHCHTLHSICTKMESYIATLDMNTINTLLHTATQRNTIQHTATCCNTLQHTAGCREGQHNQAYSYLQIDCNTLLVFPQKQKAYITTLDTKSIITLQHTATRCNTLQNTATHCNACNTLHSICTKTTHCSSTLHSICTKTEAYITILHTNTIKTLQHTATRCNILQHAATHCTVFAPKRNRTPRHQTRKYSIHRNQQRFWYLCVCVRESMCVGLYMCMCVCVCVCVCVCLCMCVFV